MLLLDADHTLDLLIDGADMPDPELYHRNVGAAVTSLMGGVAEDRGRRADS